MLSSINREFSISLRDRYTDLSDSDLDNRVREVVGGNDELGAESVWARLAGQGIVVQRHRVHQSLIRTNPVGAAQRVTTRRLHRRVYQVAGPNSLWHLDGNHKLIRYMVLLLYFFYVKNRLWHTAKTNKKKNVFC